MNYSHVFNCLCLRVRSEKNLNSSHWMGLLTSSIFLILFYIIKSLRCHKGPGPKHKQIIWKDLVIIFFVASDSKYIGTYKLTMHNSILLYSCIQLRAKVHRFILQKQTIQITNMPFERKKDHAKMFTKFKVHTHISNFRSFYSLVEKKLYYLLA